jgi:hypothetical protein
MTDTKNIVAAQRAAEAALAKAQAVLADLTRDRDAAVARQGELVKVREKLALAGLAGGAASDRRALEDATSDASRLHLQIENLNFAIQAARAEVSAAGVAVERATIRSAAVAALENVAKLRAAGFTCADALEKFVEAYTVLFGLGTEIRRSGVGSWPSMEIFALNVRRSLLFELYQAPGHLNPEPIPSPSSRRSLEELLERFIDGFEVSLQRQLGDKPEVDEAAQ